jgi:carbamoyl-phosphate synthase large subunit
VEEARAIGERLGYPILVRPSYVLGGRAMEIVRDPSHLDGLFHEALRASPEHPVLVDKFLTGAIEVDVDVLGDGETAVVAGMMEHIEFAGVHSGDSACSLPPHSLSLVLQQEIGRQAVAIATELKVVGLMNAQFAVQGGRVYLIEVNPRASRTVPFVSKAVGTPLAKCATRLMLGEKLAALGGIGRPLVPFAVKETVLPFAKFPGSDTQLGPEMHSTGEVMGRGESFAEAYLKSQIAASNGLPPSGQVFIGVRDADKPQMVPVARTLQSLGYTVIATPGTRSALLAAGLKDIVETSLESTHKGNLYEYMRQGTMALVINTTKPVKKRIDPTHFRRLVLTYNIPYCTTVQAAQAIVNALASLGKERRFTYQPLKGYAAAAS